MTLPLLNSSLCFLEVQHLVSFFFGAKRRVLYRLADVFQDNVDGLTLVTLLFVLVITLLFEDGLVWIAESVNTAVVSHSRLTINVYLELQTKRVFMLLPPSL